MGIRSRDIYVARQAERLSRQECRCSCARHGYGLVRRKEMTGVRDNNRSEGQGGGREALSAKEVRSKGTTVGTRTGSEAAMRAMSVREDAKSNRHRKTHRVEPDGTGRKSMHLTRGGLFLENGGGVSRGHSSGESRGNLEGAKGRRTSRRRSTDRLREAWREVARNNGGLATAASSSAGGEETCRWNPARVPTVDGKPPTRAKGGAR